MRMKMPTLGTRLSKNEKIRKYPFLKESGTHGNKFLILQASLSNMLYLRRIMLGGGFGDLTSKGALIRALKRGPRATH